MTKGESASSTEIIGYRFLDPGLHARALTHRSWGADHNERLEFLGDGVLDCVIAEHLYTRFAGLPEGTLSALRASLVREETLSELALSAGLAERLRVGQGERDSAHRIQASILANALEALVGAVFLDRGYGAARTFVECLYRDRLDRLDPSHEIRDPKTRLQEFLQARRWKLPAYQVVAVEGPPHSQRFSVTCAVDELGLSVSGSGTSRRRAEQEAAHAMLSMLESARER